MKLQIFFQNIDPIEIDLFNTPGVRRWFDHAKRLNHTMSYRITKKLARHPDTKKNSADWKIILDSINNLKSLGYNIPFALSQTFDYEQQTLNQIHRFFTYNSEWWWKRKTTPNPFDVNFQIPQHITNHHQWSQLLTPINEAVHSLEVYVNRGSNRSLLDKLPIEEIEFSVSERYFNFQQFTEEEQKNNFTYMDYDEPLAILNDSILGKSYLQSFLDGDDPGADDCTGRIGTFGEFWLEVNSNRRMIYNSPEFKSWLINHNIKPSTVPYDFPIGKILTRNIDHYKLCSFSFTRIEFKE